MKIYDGALDGVKIIENMCARDVRGNFIKTYNDEEFSKYGMKMGILESYYSMSHKGVIRGMHFQLPPHDHVKLVTVISGSVLDVVLDIRKGSATYGQYMTVELSGDEPKSVYIPSGFAHGFKSLADNTVMLYQVTTGYNADSDTGIAYDSIGLDWGIDNPVISDRDKGFVKLCDFESPFEIGK